MICAFFTSPKGAIAPCFMFLDLFGIILSRSASVTSPIPSQRSHAPYGELNENKLGAGSL